MSRPRLTVVACLLVLVGAAGGASAAALKLERLVLVSRHGVRPPTQPNADLAKYAARPWPAWPVAPGELTPHGGEVVALMGRTLRAAYAGTAVLPASGCPAPGAVSVWADGIDQRTRRSGEILADTLAPGCASVKAVWGATAPPRDPIFSGPPETGACPTDKAAARAALLAAIGPDGLDTASVIAAKTRLQSILAPDACAGGPGVCLTGADSVVEKPDGGTEISGPITKAFLLAEDLFLEYAEGMPAADVGWGEAASAADIAAVMPVHERFFSTVLGNAYRADRGGGPLGDLILSALAGETRAAAPAFGPDTRLVAFAGHDANLTMVGRLFDLDWTFPDEPDATGPATTLAFELLRDRAGGRFVRPVIYYESLDQLRTLRPGRARAVPLTFAGCASGPKGSCPLAELERRVRAKIPAACGAPPPG